VFDRLVELFLQFCDLFFVWNVVDEWQRGVVLRFGRPVRDAKPGIVWLWPLRIERVVVEDMFERPAALPVQSLTTADGHGVAVSAIIVYRVQNARKVILRTGGHEQALIATVPAVVASHVTAAKWEDLMSQEFLDAVTSDVRAEAKTWGIKVLSVRFGNVAKAPTLRLLAEQSHS
jgi:regulator of protease activity HflC (stomatin/prohibitin superfamily)